MGSFVQSFNLFDVLFIAFLLYFIAGSKSVIFALFDLVGFIITILISYAFYAPVSDYFVQYFSLSKGIAQASSFFTIWFITETVLFIVGRIVLAKIPEKIYRHKLNEHLAFIPSALHALLFFTLITVTLFSLPVRATVKEVIVHSKTGPYFIQFSNVLEKRIKNVFGGAVQETLNFLTIKPGSGEGVNLGFKAPESALSVDETSEVTMFSLINKERTAHGLEPLIENAALRDVARAYATEMFTNGFFAHESAIDGSTPAQRVERNGITYLVTGENLAYAPDVYLAHEGLMNSPGHRANILSPDYGKVGIGVIDGGIYGRIFVQEFTD
jgi:uncharacterized protein YkwD